MSKDEILWLLTLFLNFEYIWDISRILLDSLRLPETPWDYLRLPETLWRLPETPLEWFETTFSGFLNLDHSGKNTRLFACNQPTKKLANANLFIQHNCFYSPVKKFSNYLPKVNILGSNHRIFLRSRFCLNSILAYFA